MARVWQKHLTRFGYHRNYKETLIVSTPTNYSDGVRLSITRTSGKLIVASLSPEDVEELIVALQYAVSLNG